MATERPCKFYRTSKHPGMGCGIANCDLGIIWTICDGDMRFCENPDALIKNLYVQWGREKRGRVKHGAQCEANL